MPKPSYEDVAKRIKYDPSTGEFWRIDGGTAKPIDSISVKGYRYVSLGGDKYTAQQIAWLLMNREWPEKKVEFVDGDRTNLVWSNIRAIVKSTGNVDVEHARLLELLDYEPITGEFRWRKFKGSPTKAGEVAGGPDGRYWCVGIDQRLYLAHRLAWFYVNKKWPEHEIDHMDGDGKNNAISNLRDVTHAVNMQNIRQKTKRNKTSEFMGVHVDKSGRSSVRLTAFGKSVHIGSFASQAEAHQAYIAAKRLHHPGCTI